MPELAAGLVALLRSALFELMSDLPFMEELCDLSAFFSEFFMLDSRVLPAVPEASWSLAMPPDLAMPLRGLVVSVAGGVLELRGVPEASLGLFVPEPAMPAGVPPLALGIAGLRAALPAAEGFSALRGFPEASLGLFVPEPAIPAVEPAAVPPVCAWATLPSNNEAAIATVMEMDFKKIFFDMLFPLPRRVVKHYARHVAASRAFLNLSLLACLFHRKKTRLPVGRMAFKNKNQRCQLNCWQHSSSPRGWVIKQAPCRWLMPTIELLQQALEKTVQRAAGQACLPRAG